jgi:hypothetical protein
MLVLNVGASLGCSSGRREGEASGVGEHPFLEICSFNIQFLGSEKERDNVALASVLADCDIAVIQELVAPPIAVSFEDGSQTLGPDPEARAFFEEMEALGFSWELSEEDTGPGETIHNDGTATEWWVAFYREDSVSFSLDLPTEFLAEDRSANPDFERVPHAFSFESADGELDFTLISVHLNTGEEPMDEERRAEELAAVATWIGDRTESERDYFILGDFNFINENELDAFSPFKSLNASMDPTNTSWTPRAYDHVFYDPLPSPEVDTEFGVEISDLVQEMRPFWTDPAPYPGDPYDHDAFRVHYSDHQAIRFRLTIPRRDDD